MWVLHYTRLQTFSIGTTKAATRHQGLQAAVQPSAAGWACLGKPYFACISSCTSEVRFPWLSGVPVVRLSEYAVLTGGHPISVKGCQRETLLVFNKEPPQELWPRPALPNASMSPDISIEGIFGLRLLGLKYVCGMFS